MRSDKKEQKLKRDLSNFGADSQIGLNDDLEDLKQSNAKTVEEENQQRGFSGSVFCHRRRATHGSSYQ